MYRGTTTSQTAAIPIEAQMSIAAFDALIIFAGIVGGIVSVLVGLGYLLLKFI